MASSALDLENFTCAICRDIYTDPVTIPCGHNHMGCKDCMSPLMKECDAKCPVCRGDLKSRSLRINKNLLTQMKTTKLPCFGCNQQVLVVEMNAHLAGCENVDKSITYFKPVSQTTQRIPKNLPNRSTFKCPYCEVENLDTNGLRKHCNEKHKYDSTHVVCPVCASMPWGNTNQASSDFIKHLDIRHKFEYDTYVDYNQDDEAMLQAAIQASLEQSNS